jgi:hypothetical protein
MPPKTFATHWWDRGGGLAPLCRTVRTRGPLLFASRPTCRRCRFYRLAPTLGREGALARMAAEDAAANPE